MTNINSFYFHKEEILHNFLNSNEGRAWGFAPKRCWFPWEASRQISFVSAFFSSADWNNWLKALSACSQGNYTESFTSYEYESRLKKENPKLTLSSYKVNKNDKKKLNKLQKLSENWFWIASNKKEKSRRGTDISLFEDSRACAHCIKECAVHEIAENTSFTYEVFECKDLNEVVYGMALISHRPSEEGESDLSTVRLEELITNPLALRSKENETETLCAKGVGTALLYKILQKCVEEETNLEFGVRNSSVPFYEKHGFEVLDKNAGTAHCELTNEKIQKLLANFQIPSSFEL